MLKVVCTKILRFCVFNVEQSLCRCFRHQGWQFYVPCLTGDVSLQWHFAVHNVLSLWCWSITNFLKIQSLKIVGIVKRECIGLDPKLDQKLFPCMIQIKISYYFLGYGSKTRRKMESGSLRSVSYRWHFVAMKFCNI
jgi:hypothetical protein